MREHVRERSQTLPTDSDQYPQLYELAALCYRTLRIAGTNVDSYTRPAHSRPHIYVMAPQHGYSNGQHAAHDSALSVGATDDALRIKDLENEVRFLAEKTTSACMFHLPLFLYRCD